MSHVIHVAAQNADNMIGKTVYVLTRITNGDVVVQGIYTTKKKAEKAKEAFEDECAYKFRTEGEYQFDWYIGSEKIE